jgi:hypothetical protein
MLACGSSAKFSVRALVPLLLQIPPDLLQRIDDERRVAAFGPVPSRCATIRMLLAEGLAFRQSARPKSSGAGRGEPYPISVEWLKDLLR